MVFEYIQDRFRTAYKYFACPQRRGAGGGNQGKKTAAGQGERKQDPCPKRGEDNKEGETSQREVQASKEDSESESDDDDGSDLSGKSGEKSLDTGVMDLVLNDGSKSSSSPKGLLVSDEVEEDEEPATSDDLLYVFDKMIFTGGKVSNTLHSLK